MKSNNVKRIILSIVTILIMLCGVAQSAVYAADGTTKATITKWRYLKIKNGDTYTFEKKKAYATNNDRKIFQILEVDDTSNTKDTLYCLNATKGEIFGTNEGASSTEINEAATATYTQSYNLKDDATNSIIDLKKVDAVDVDHDGVNDYTNVDTRKSVIWLLENLYASSENVSDSTYKDDFMAKIGIYKDDKYTEEKVYRYHKINGEKWSDYDWLQYPYGYYYDEADTAGNVTIKDALIEDDLIEAVQQTAIWYFTNYLNYNKNNNFDKYAYVRPNPDDPSKSKNETTWLKYYNESKDAYENLTELGKNDTEVGAKYQEQASILYNYLINKALEAGTSTADENKDIKIDRSSAKIVEKDDGYYIGPITVNTNGTGIKVTVQDNDGNDITSDCSFSKTTIISGEEFYITVPKSTDGNVTVKAETTGYETIATVRTDATNKEQPIVKLEKTKSTPNVSTPFSITKEFDLALRKIITGVKKADGTAVKTVNENGYDATRTINITDTIPNTATYKHRKDPVVVEEGYKVTYNLNVYNEGDVNGYASEITDQLPTGLISTLKVGDTLTSSKGNQYKVKSYSDNKLVLEFSGTTPTLLNAHTSKGTIDSDTISLECTVTQKTDDKKHYLTNIAYISQAKDSKGVVDQDGHEGSKPSVYPNYAADQLNKDKPAYTGSTASSIFTVGTNNDFYFVGQEDDDDFETLVLLPKEFDLKLVKYISAINGVTSNRKITVDSSKLNTTVNGKKVTTADYDVSKVPLTVKTGDIVTYTFRIYNEAETDGYATEISEDIPEGLEFVYSTHGTDAEIDADTTLTDKEKAAIKFNRNYLWQYDPKDTSKKTIISSYLSEATSKDNLIKAFDSSKDKGKGEGLSYKELSVMFKVTSTDVSKIIRNEAAITEDSGDDRDSDTEKWNKEDSNDNYEDNKDYPKYKEDDEDYDNIKLARFDLALRKFITAISNDATISDGEYLSADKTDKTEYTRAPKVDSSKLKSGKETTAIYNHSKDPITVNGGDYVLYTIRVYNEGDLDGYAAEIKDYLPEYLNFVSGEFNTKYGWEYNANDRTISTKYLSSANGATNLLKAFDAIKDDGKGSGLSYKDVPILCRVSSKAVADKNITNIAEITVYQDENGNNKENDIDSTPNNLKYPEDPSKYEGNRDGKNASDKYYPGQEDDDDFDRVKVENLEFDLSLLKYVSEVKVTENGTTTTTKTGNKGDKNDIIPKVEIHRKHIKSTTVKFIFTIKITNEGDIAGYAKEITDYIPSGLEFYNEDNKGWTKKGNKVTTTLLADTLLQPGESATVKITFRWKKSESNLGLKTNVAEISKDYNEKGVPDRDSTPGNKKDGEDDIDDAQVLLSIKTGITDNIIAYVSGAAVILLVIAGGVILIKKFVL